MPDREAHVDTLVAGAKFITVYDVQSACHRIVVAEAEQGKPPRDTERLRISFVNVAHDKLKNPSG